MDVLSWQEQLKQLVQTPDQLIDQLALPENLKPSGQQADQLFKTRVPRAFLNRIEPGNINDPLLLQILPVVEELSHCDDYSIDPLQENDKNPIPGLLHKYHGRVLLIVIGTCAINCRYCFRRHFPYQDNNPGKTGWQKALDYIAEDDSIHEVIFSGGDPLMATDQYLAFLIDKIEQISHVTTLRIHSRMPIVVPARVTDDFIKLLRKTRLNIIMVVHCNHASEINLPAQDALNKMHLAGITLLNQSVLLNNINNSVEALESLSHALFQSHVLPYYLHVLDKIQGAAHFAVSEDKALHLIEKLKMRLPGYLVPKLVREIPGELSKSEVNRKIQIC